MATGLLMERFYHHLNEGLSKAGAMRQAQLDMLELLRQSDNEDSFYWAAFVMSGDGGPVAEILRPESKIPPPETATYEAASENETTDLKPEVKETAPPSNWLWWIIGSVYCFWAGYWGGIGAKAAFCLNLFSISD